MLGYGKAEKQDLFSSSDYYSYYFLGGDPLLLWGSYSFNTLEAFHGFSLGCKEEGVPSPEGDTFLDTDGIGR